MISLYKLYEGVFLKAATKFIGGIPEQFSQAKTIASGTGERLGTIRNLFRRAPGEYQAAKQFVSNTPEYGTELTNKVKSFANNFTPTNLSNRLATDIRQSADTNRIIQNKKFVDETRKINAGISNIKSSPGYKPDIDDPIIKGQRDKLKQKYTDLIGTHQSKYKVAKGIDDHPYITTGAVGAVVPGGAYVGYNMVDPLKNKLKTKVDELSSDQTNQENKNK